MNMKRLTTTVRERIIARAAHDVALEYGILEAANAERVAATCSVHTSVATVRRYYPTQDDLIRAAARVDNADEHVVREARELGLA